LASSEKVDVAVAVAGVALIIFPATAPMTVVVASTSLAALVEARVETTAAPVAELVILRL